MGEEKKEVTANCKYKHRKVGKDLNECKGCDVYHDERGCGDGCDNCNNCGEPTDCQVEILKEIKVKESAFANTEKLEKSAELEKVKDDLCKKFGINKDELDSSFSQFIANIQSDAETQVISRLDSILRSKINQVVESKADAMIEEMYTKAVEEKILQFASDENCIMSIQKYASMRVKKFFDDGWDDRDRRDDVTKKTFEQVIQRVAHGKTDDVLQEIAKESIEKFNKEMMKTMMKGMAKQLGDNPNL